ncbi:MAG: hypothetical protein V2A62_02335 [Candidatus Woesearchaeota archaeon]
MVHYGSHTVGYGSNWQVQGYGSNNNSCSGSNYSITTNSWHKSTCCGAFRAVQRCSDCPGN